jgi:hypothetical protein
MQSSKFKMQSAKRWHHVAARWDSASYPRRDPADWKSAIQQIRNLRYLSTKRLT